MFTSLTPCLLSVLKDGRQPIYLASLPLLCIGSFGAAICQNLWQLAVARAIQAFGASTFLSVGAATIGDLYRVEERGTVMGIYFGVGPFCYCPNRV